MIKSLKIDISLFSKLKVRRHEECANGLHRLERKMSSDLTNSPLCREYEDGHQDLKKVAEDYQSVVYQLGHATGDLTHLSQKTVVEPMKKVFTSCQRTFLGAA